MSHTFVEISNEEMMVVDGGIGSAEVKLTAALCLCSVFPGAAISFAVLSYANTKFTENYIEY